MSSDARDDVTLQIRGLKAGEEEAVRWLWERYYGPLLKVARRYLKSVTFADEEDAALSAFRSFCRRAKDGGFERLEDRNDLWQLLITITSRKSIKLIQSEGRLKRGGGRVRTETDLSAETRDVGWMSQVPSAQPDPASVTAMTDECQRLFDLLPREDFRQIAALRLEEYTNDEIATKLGCSKATVERRLQAIRAVWAQYEP